MMLRHTFLTLVLFTLACTNQQEPHAAYAEEIKQHRKEITRRFLVDASSPLEEKDKKYFVGLNYFKADPDYKVWAQYEELRVKNSFKLSTTGKQREVAYDLVGNLRFELGENLCSLGVFKSSDGSYFVPFGDQSNGNETYEAGRYIDMETIDSSHVLLDFNKAYNPYCAYNEKYSCVIPPPENRLNLRIEAGEKKFKN